MGYSAEVLGEMERFQLFNITMHIEVLKRSYQKVYSLPSYQTELIKPSKYIQGFFNLPLEAPRCGKLRYLRLKYSFITEKDRINSLMKAKCLASSNCTYASEALVADGYGFTTKVVTQKLRRDWKRLEELRQLNIMTYKLTRLCQEN